MSCTNFLFTVPENVSAPVVFALVPGQLAVSWEAPAQPNGVILYYIIERAIGGTENFTQLDIHNATSSILFYGDTAIDPYTQYSYRIVAVNSAGSGTGPTFDILSPEAGIFFNYFAVYFKLIIFVHSSPQLQRAYCHPVFLSSPPPQSKSLSSLHSCPMEKLQPTYSSDIHSAHPQRLHSIQVHWVLLMGVLSTLTLTCCHSLTTLTPSLYVPVLGAQLVGRCGQ